MTEATGTGPGRIQWAAWLLLLAASPLALASAEREPLAPLDEIMAPETYSAAGLDKLTPAEREALRDWMEGYLAGERQEAAEVAAKEAVAEVVPQGDDSFGIEDVRERVVAIFERDQPEAIRSPIEGRFRGWSGRTTFRLANGQVWRQAEDDDFHYPGDPESAVAIIEKGMFGAYYLKVEGYGSRVKVRRLE